MADLNREVTMLPTAQDSAEVTRVSAPARGGVCFVVAGGEVCVLGLATKAPAYMVTGTFTDRSRWGDERVITTFAYAGEDFVLGPVTVCPHDTGHHPRLRVTRLTGEAYEHLTPADAEELAHGRTLAVGEALDRARDTIEGVCDRLARLDAGLLVGADRALLARLRGQVLRLITVTAEVDRDSG